MVKVDVKPVKLRTPKAIAKTVPTNIPKPKVSQIPAQPTLKKSPLKNLSNPTLELKNATLNPNPPNKELLERIQRTKEQRRRKKEGIGYSGQFKKVASNKNKAKTDVKPKDIYALRAQQAGLDSDLTNFKNKSVKGSNTPQTKQRKPKNPEKRQKFQEENVNRVIATLSRTPRKPVRQKVSKETQISEEQKTVEVPEFVTIAELAGLLNIPSNQVIAKCMEFGMLVTINQRLEQETITIIADEFGINIKPIDNTQKEEEEEESNITNAKHRPAIVTIMGHVDHGKTSVLDYIRKTKVVEGESGGITQHIGAYSVNTPSGKITFLDTPGHEAFTSMRSRGANITDIIVLVVAADSAVMPQTKEAIQHAKNSNVQMIVAINKCDLPNANIDKIKSQLTEEGVQVDSYGGNVSSVEISAKTGENMNKLLETINVESEILELSASYDGHAKGTVIETTLDKGKGIIATIIVQSGILKTGDFFVCGSYSGKVRALNNDQGKKIDKAEPSTPVQVLGLVGTPISGDRFTVYPNISKAKEMAEKRLQAAQIRERGQKQHITLEQLHEQIKSGEFHQLNLIIKADVDGSLEAIANSLDRLSTENVKVNILHKEVGAIKESDIQLAAASNAIIISFHLLPSEKLRKMADNEGVSIESFRTIYEVIDSIHLAMEGLLNPEIVEVVTGEAELLQVFKIPKVGFIAGCKVNSGIVDRESFVRLYRKGIEVGDAEVTSLKRHKDDVKSVKAGFECGIGISKLQDIQEGDILAFFKKKKVAKKLSDL